MKKIRMQLLFFCIMLGATLTIHASKETLVTVGQPTIAKSSRMVYGITNPPNEAHPIFDSEHHIYGVVESARGELEKYANAAYESIEQTGINQKHITQLRYEVLGELFGKTLHQHLRIALSRDADLCDEDIKQAFSDTWEAVKAHNFLDNKIRVSIVHINKSNNMVTSISLNRKTAFLYGKTPERGSCVFNAPPFPRRTDERDKISITRLPLNETMKILVLTNEKFGYPLTRYVIDCALGKLEPIVQNIQTYLNSVISRQVKRWTQDVQEQRSMNISDDKIDATIPSNVLIVIPIISCENASRKDSPQGFLANAGEHCNNTK